MVAGVFRHTLQYYKNCRGEEQSDKCQIHHNNNDNNEKRTEEKEKIETLTEFLVKTDAKKTLQSLITGAHAEACFKDRRRISVTSEKENKNIEKEKKEEHFV